MANYTQDNIAIGIIATCKDRCVDDVGTVATLSCGLVESNLTMYANEEDPETLAFPYDALSRDHDSSGVYQQRPPWWGNAQCRMDVRCSTNLFLDQFLKHPYHDGRQSVGLYVADVQQCARIYRGRYDERMGEAWDYYNRLKEVPAAPTPGVLAAAVQQPYAPPKPSFTEIEAFGWGRNNRTRPAINWFIHTEEGNSSALQLARFCNGSNNVSYHYTVRDGIVCDVVDTDYYSWSVLDANVFSINGCFAGSSAGWSRNEWMKRERDIEIMAYLAVQDCIKYPSMNTLVIPPPYDFHGPGIADHKYVTEALNIGTHHDVGDEFPWDVLAHYVDTYNGFKGSGDDNMTKEEHDALMQLAGAHLNPVYSTSVYAPPGTQFALKDLNRFTNGTTHEISVEHCAIILGSPDDIKTIKDAMDRGVDRAIRAWQHIPDEYKIAAGYGSQSSQETTSWSLT
jgi:hypothetical protein